MAKGGRVSNPVPGRVGPWTGIMPEIAVARRAMDLSSTAMPKLELELPKNAM